MSVPVDLRRFAVIASLGLGCGAGDDDTMMPVTPEATIGAGETDFAPLQDGATASVILGPQGGYHIIGSVRAVGIEPGDPSDLSSPDNPTTTFSVESGGVKIDAGGANYTQGLDRAADGRYEMVGRIVILDIVSADAIAGDPIRFDVTIADVDGVTVTDSVNLVAMPDPRNP